MRPLPAPIALWALTPNGALLAGRLAELWPHEVGLYLSERTAQMEAGAKRFDKLGPAVEKYFRSYRAHVFFMATGIVVRTIAPLLGHKTKDPAVVVVDDRASWAISLVSGHLGGANRLAAHIAESLGAQAVITTATDVNRKPAVDLVAQKLGLAIENPEAIQTINMALLTDAALLCHDPFKLVMPHLPQAAPAPLSGEEGWPDFGDTPGICVDDRRMTLPPQVLVLRPPSLVVGMGCNRGTPKTELRSLLDTALERHGLALGSLSAIASVDLKADEAGLLELAAELGLPLECHSRAILATVTNTPSPSAMVQKHIGVPSVCEAAALTTAPSGDLIIPKMKTPNVTVAVARRASISSASAPETPPTSR